MNIRTLERRVVRCSCDTTVRVPSTIDRSATHGQWSKRPIDGSIRHFVGALQYRSCEQSGREVSV